MSSLRERLLNRPRPSGEVPLRITDDTAAREDVERERRLLAMLQLQGGVEEAVLRRARAAVAKAEKKLRACYEFITVRALVPEDFEALVALHPPRPDTKDQMWNRDTFPKAAFFACVESDMSAEEWEQTWASGLSSAERIELGNAAIRVNIRTPDESLPKGWALTEDSS
ncbi:hypothetical protein ACU635_50555 [[Actinomadura] parvosata]|uniref:hypothetical protein n=1 Tax=[Actinomadura] parvosata TaxID=1955412 RepID=UPI00406CF063